MTIIETMRGTRSADEVCNLLTTYVYSLRLTNMSEDMFAQVATLPLGGKQDVIFRLHALLRGLDAASRRLDDRACAVIKEAVYVFGAALERLHAFDRTMLCPLIRQLVDPTPETMQTLQIH